MMDDECGMINGGERGSSVRNEPETPRPGNESHVWSEGVRRRVVIVGLDGATFDVILPLAESGRLPHLARLMEAGAWGRLRSTLPPLSPVAWSSFLTGKNPGRHGVFGFEEIEPGSYNFRPVSSCRTGHRTLWRLVSDAGRRVVALDIPFSYPPEPVNGCLIAGYGAPTGKDSVFTYPPSLRQELAKRFGQCEVAVPQMKAAPPRQALFRRWDQILDNRRRIADHLLREADWDVFAIVLGVTDHIQHGAWTYLEPLHPDSRRPEAARFRETLFQYYEKADAFIGGLLEAADGPIHTIVLSDHGFGTSWSGHLTRQALADAGWLQYRSLRLFGATAGLLVESLHKVYDSMSPLKRLLHRHPAGRRRLKRAMAQAIDWSRTSAFAAALGRQVFINRQGAFPHGIVESGPPYESLCEEIRKRLENLVAPGTNRRLIARVWRREEIYQGEAVPLAPDLVVEYANLHGARPSEAAANWDIVGAHTMDGVLIAAGPEIKSMRLDGARILDVAPTALYLMNLPVPDDFDGRVLTEIVRDEALRASPPRRVGAESGAEPPVRREGLLTEEARSISEQLRNLGYLD